MPRTVLLLRCRYTSVNFGSRCPSNISTEPAFFDNILEYNGKYYEIGCKRVVVKENKTENDNYYLLTLAAIAKELKKRGKHQAKVFIAAGLPLSRFGDEKESFTQYLKANRNVRFKYNTELFDVEIVNVAVFPQCYAAVVDQIGTFRQKVIVVDVGSWTIDIMPIENKKPINEKCISKPIGLITCIRDVNSECYRKLGEEVDECIIQSVIEVKILPYQMSMWKLSGIRFTIMLNRFITVLENTELILRRQRLFL